LTVSDNAKFNAKEIRECGLQERYGLLVLGAKSKSSEIEFNPAPTEVLTAGTTLIVMGAVEQIAKAKNSF
jgi:K+/H+ antiporter YhaU regulatory subunit KhtT